MEKVLFNSRSELDRLPFGAMPAGETLCVGLRVASALRAEDVRLVFRCDADGRETEQPLEHVWSADGWDRFEGCVAQERAGLYWYAFRLSTAEGPRSVSKGPGNRAELTAEAPVFWQLTVYESDYTTPAWIVGGVFYQIFVDRFCKGGEHPLRDGQYRRDDWGGTPKFAPDADGITRRNDFFGGDLAGVIEKLPFLQELGVSCLYLNPIFEASSNHKYDTGDYKKIDPAFGDEADFQKLCREAKARGIHVILDGVFNHTGDDSIYFNRYGRYDSLGAYQSRASRYFNWYAFSDWPESYESWWGIKTLPRIRAGSLDFCDYLCDEGGVVKKWLALGADGWRLDVVDELTDGLVRAIRLAARQDKPDALLIGEVWEDASNKIAYGERRHYFEGAELDGTMNYPFRVAILRYAADGDAAALGEAVESIVEDYPKPALDCLMNNLSTHDTPRLLTVLTGAETPVSLEAQANYVFSPEQTARARALVRLATVLQFTLPGVPCVYYGDEAGLDGFGDPFCRKCYPWGQEDGKLMNWYRALIRVRRGADAYAGGTYRTVRAKNGLYAFERRTKDSRALTVVNMGGETDYPLPAGAVPLLGYEAERAGDVLCLQRYGCAILSLDA